MIRGSNAGMPTAPEDSDMTVSDARREGSAADWVANGVLRGDAGSAAEFDGETAPNGWIVTPDMVRHVQGYIDYCRSRGNVVRAQVPIEIPHLFIRGVADVQVVPDSTTLEVIDLKYGWQIVEPEFNAQLLCEGLALWRPDQHTHVTMTIYQPRPHHPAGKARSWSLDEAELTTAYYWLSRKAMEASSPGAVATVGADWCGVCPGRGRCDALRRATGTIFETICGGMVTGLDAGALGAELAFVDQAFDLVKAFRSGVKAEVEARMKRGEHIPGWWFDQPLRDREWTETPEEVEGRTGLDVYKQVLKSPAELEKDGADPDIVNQMTHRPHAAPRLAPANKKAFARMFSKVIGK